MNEQKSKFWRQWAIDGMPKDKQRLAEAAWNEAIKACASFVEDHGINSESGHEDCQGCGEILASELLAQIAP